MRRPWTTVAVYGAIAALLLLLGWALAKVQGGQVDTGMAPDFTLTSFDGETITLSELRGRVVIINMDGVPKTYYVAKNGELRGVKIRPLVPPELDQKIEELLVEITPDGRD